MQRTLASAIVKQRPAGYNDGMDDNADKPSQSIVSIGQFRIVDLLALTAIVAIGARIVSRHSHTEELPWLLAMFVAVWIAWFSAIIWRGTVNIVVLLLALLTAGLFWLVLLFPAMT